MNYLAMFGMPQYLEWGLLVLLGLVLFGRKLPGIARSLGQSIVEFKKGVKGIKDEVDQASDKTVEASQTKKEVIDVDATSKASSESQS